MRGKELPTESNMQKTSPWLIATRVLFTFALIACIVFIFSNSMQIADVSSVASGRALTLLRKVFTRLGMPGIASRLTDHIVRKMAHFCEYMLEGFLLTLCLRVYTRHFVRHMSWPILGGVLTALSDETIQMFVPGRSSSVRDVWIDTAGVLAGLLVALLLLLIVRGVAAYAAVKKENRALRAERDRLLLAEREREHTRLARRAAHRAQQEENTQHEEEPQ